jgi:hypothetical protein
VVDTDDRLITYSVRLAKVVKSRLYDSLEETETASTKADKEEEDISTSDLEYCCISIMHYPSTTTRVYQFEKMGAGIRTGRALIFGSSLEKRQTFRTLNHEFTTIQVLSNSCKFKQCSTILSLSHLSLNDLYCPPAALARSITLFNSSAASTNALPNFSASLFLVVMHHLMWSSWIE